MIVHTHTHTHASPSTPFASHSVDFDAGPPQIHPPTSGWFSLSLAAALVLAVRSFRLRSAASFARRGATPSALAVYRA